MLRLLFKLGASCAIGLILAFLCASIGANSAAELYEHASKLGTAFSGIMCAVVLLTHTKQPRK